MFAMVPAALLENEELSAHEKLVVTALLLHRNQKSGDCYPRVARICRLASLSRMTVFRALSTLEEKGIINRKRRFTRYGDYDTSAYVMGGWYQSDTTPYQADTRVVSEGYYGWYQGDTLTKNINKEEEHINEPENPSPQGQVLEPKSKPIGEIRAEQVKLAFEKFWKEYPKRQGKKAAFTEFQKLFPVDFSSEQLNQRLSNLYRQLTQYAETVRDTEPKFIKNPANWLKAADPDEAVLIEEEVWVRVEEGD